MKTLSFVGKTLGVAVITGIGAAIGSIFIGEMFWTIFGRSPKK